MLKIGIIGLGYVGLPLAVEFGKKYDVVGFDLKESRIAELRAGKDSTLETSPEQLSVARLLRFTTDYHDLAECNRFIVTVPTPVDEHNAPDLSPVLSATTTVGKVHRRF